MLILKITVSLLLPRPLETNFYSYHKINLPFLKAKNSKTVWINVTIIVIPSR